MKAKDIQGEGRYKTTIDFTHLSTDYFYPVWFKMPDNSHGKNKISVVRHYTSDYNRDPFGDGDHHVAGLNVQLEGCGYAWNGDANYLTIKRISQTYRKTIRCIKFGLKSIARHYRENAQDTRPIYNSYTDGQAVSCDTHSGFYLRGGLSYEVITNASMEIQSYNGTGIEEVSVYSKRENSWTIDFKVKPYQEDDVTLGDDYDNDYTEAEAIKQYAETKATEAGESAKSHANTRASLAERNAETHADAKATQAETRANAYTDNQLDSFKAVETGTVVEFAKKKQRTGYEYCDGSAINSRHTDLIAEIGTDFSVDETPRLPKFDDKIGIPAGRRIEIAYKHEYAKKIIIAPSGSSFSVVARASRHHDMNGNSTGVSYPEYIDDICYEPDGGNLWTVGLREIIQYNNLGSRTGRRFNNPRSLRYYTMAFRPDGSRFWLSKQPHKANLTIAEEFDATTHQKTGKRALITLSQLSTTREPFIKFDKNGDYFWVSINGGLVQFDKHGNRTGKKVDTHVYSPYSPLDMCFENSGDYFWVVVKTVSNKEYNPKYWPCIIQFTKSGVATGKTFSIIMDGRTPSLEGACSIDMHPTKNIMYALFGREPLMVRELHTNMQTIGDKYTYIKT